MRKAGWTPTNRERSRPQTLGRGGERGEVSEHPASGGRSGTSGKATWLATCHDVPNRASAMCAGRPMDYNPSPGTFLKLFSASSSHHGQALVQSRVFKMPCCKKLLDLPAVTRSPQAVKTLLMLANSEKVAPRHRDRMCSLLCTGRRGQIALRLKLSVAVVVVLPRVCHATPASDNLASDTSTVQPPLPPSHHLQATSSVLLIWQQPLH